jgi:mannose-6-phosphate isomerase-like protein (cupin superfamily)
MKTLTIRVVIFGVSILVACSVKLSAQSKTAWLETKKPAVYTIGNCVNALAMEKTEKTEVGYQYWFADKDFADGKTLKLSVVAPHSVTHPPHVHQEDEFFFVLEGQAECSLQGQKKVVGPYTSFYCPSNVEHGIRNVGEKELKYLVIKKYLKN